MPKTSLVELTPELRFKQIAAILAKGVIRCKRRFRDDASPPGENSSAGSAIGLEVAGETRLTVTKGAV